jgi:hypothetical protein
MTELSPLSIDIEDKDDNFIEVSEVGEAQLDENTVSMCGIKLNPGVSRLNLMSFYLSYSSSFMNM